MGNRTSTISKMYRVGEDDEVKVTVVIGSGQPGGWALSIDGKLLASGEGEEMTVALGTGRELCLLELRIDYVLHDRRWEHDRLMATAIIQGGKDKLCIVHEQSGEPGDSATYTTLIQFILGM